MLRSKNNNLIWNGSGPRLETGHPVIGYEEFVSSLPPACSDSTISTGADGTVIIFVACKKEGQSTHSMIEIKNGIVKKIR